MEAFRGKGPAAQWKADLQHIRNHLTEEQPGTCDGGDIKQMKKDNRPQKRELGAKRAKQKGATWEKKVSSKVNVNRDEDEKNSTEAKSKSDEEG